MTEFRPEMWPASRLPVPEVEAGPVYLDRDGFLCAFEDGAPTTLRRIPVTDELYLRVLPSLDLSDAEAIRRFTREHGSLYAKGLWKVLEAADVDDRLSGDVESLNKAALELRLRVMERYTDLLGQWKGTVAEKIAAEPSAERRDDMARLLRVGTPSIHATCHVDEVRRTMALLRDLVRVWAWHQGKLSFTKVQTEWESPVRPASNDGTLWPSKDQALKMLEATLNLGLAELRPSISLFGSTNPRTEDGDAVSLFAALCVQFANHIADNSEYKRCENCGQWFVLQTGRAKQGQHRHKSVKYCSRSCARAKAERDRYAEKRKRGGQKVGTKAHEQPDSAEGGDS